MLEMFRIPLFGKKKLLLSFEYGLIIAKLAEEHKVEVTPELIARAEAMLLGEARTQSAAHMAVNTIPNLLSVFEIDITK